MINGHLSVLVCLTTTIHIYALDGNIVNKLEINFGTCIGEAGNIRLVKLENKLNIWNIRVRKYIDKSLPTVYRTMLQHMSF